MVYRIYVEKKQGFDLEAQRLLSDCRELLEIAGGAILILIGTKILLEHLGIISF